MSVSSIAPMLMFKGRAHEAITFYTELFAGSGVDFIQQYGPDFPSGPEGQIVHSRFHLGEVPFLAMDTGYVEHKFDFTPAISFYVTCDSDAEVDRLYAAFVEGGTVMMELGEYPFASKYAWVQDRFGVSWQLVSPRGMTNG